MRLSILSDEISQDLGVAIKTAQQFGFAGLEIRSVDNIAPHQFDDVMVRSIRNRLDDGGLVASAFCPPALKCLAPSDPGAETAVVDVLRRAVDHAAILGTGAVRIFSFYRDGEVPHPRQAAEVARRVLARVDLPAGVRLVLETGTRSNTPTLAHAREFLTALDDDRIGVLWDPGNTVFSGFDSHPFPGDFEVGADLIRHVHVKDPRSTTGYVGLGDGDLPWPEILRALDERGFDGWLTLETHWRQDRELTGKERDEPWGAGISDGGQAASAICMRVLSGWLDELRVSR
ncbi:MAG TPA: sugar phosphate isomerase/epimerase family protein [Kineosporiaceae bacterium]|nr:sugar phosphate isomerase/epimerase family protein [Kineosporiaceae bacterium]